MKILTVADVPAKALWDYYDESRLKGVDLILSAGDLPAAYLSFLVTFAPGPVFYVHGNHDDRYAQKPPEGCICIDGKLVEYEGVRILGLGGSFRYNDGVNQYSEREMAKRVRRLNLSIRRHHGFDILLTHAPAKGQGDLPDLPHQGFETFNRVMDRWHPKYMIHGHVHMNYAASVPRTRRYGETTIINAYERYLFDYDDPV